MKGGGFFLIAAGAVRLIVHGENLTGALLILAGIALESAA